MCYVVPDTPGRKAAILLVVTILVPPRYCPVTTISLSSSVEGITGERLHGHATDPPPRQALRRGIRHACARAFHRLAAAHCRHRRRGFQRHCRGDSPAATSALSPAAH